jgi:D-lyxose ketol-isomerase
MKRSELNQIISSSLGFCAERRFALPPFAFLSLHDWKARAGEYQEVLDNQMGWDVGDFGTGDFARVGALLFVLRNGNCSESKYRKPYCEKILIQAEGQVCPLHFHWRKMEDIINRGGGTLVVSATTRSARASSTSAPPCIFRWMDALSPWAPANPSKSRPEKASP